MQQTPYLRPIRFILATQIHNNTWPRDFLSSIKK